MPRALAVWDPLVRLAHWGLALAVATAWWLDDGGRLHRAIGYAAMSLVLARLAWAVLQPGWADLHSLRPSLHATIAYLRAGAPRHIGHDPLGLWMVWLLWLLVLLLALTGWMSRLDAFWGDDRVHTVHALIANTLAAAAAVHVLGVLAMSWRWGENLARAMVTGLKSGKQKD